LAIALCACVGGVIMIEIHRKTREDGGREGDGIGGGTSHLSAGKQVGSFGSAAGGRAAWSPRREGSYIAWPWRRPRPSRPRRTGGRRTPRPMHLLRSLAGAPAPTTGQHRDPTRKHSGRKGVGARSKRLVRTRIGRPTAEGRPNCRSLPRGRAATSRGDGRGERKSIRFSSPFRLCGSPRRRASAEPSGFWRTAQGQGAEAPPPRRPP